MLIEGDAQLFEYLIGEVYRTILQEGDVAVDVGANEGVHTRPLADAVGATGTVYVFEPIPSHFHRLAAWCGQPATGRARVVLSSHAISDRTGPCEFFVNLSNTAYYSGLKPHEGIPGMRYGSIRGMSQTLDVALRDATALRFIKIDVDGGEYGVISGAREVLDRFRPVIAFEFGDLGLDAYGVCSSSMFQLLEERGYLVGSITGTPIDSVAAFCASSRRQEVWNYVAVHRDDRATFDALMHRLHAIDHFVHRDLARDVDDLRCDVTMDRSHLELTSSYDCARVCTVLRDTGAQAIVPVAMDPAGRGHPVIGLRWFVDGTYVTEDRFPLPGAIFVGESVAVDLPIYPWTPDRYFVPGRYTLQVQLVSELVTWVPTGAVVNVTIR